MATNRDAARAMLKHGQLKHRMLAAFWWRARADRDEIEQAHAEEFDAFRKVAHAGETSSGGAAMNSYDIPDDPHRLPRRSAGRL